MRNWLLTLGLGLLGLAAMEAHATPALLRTKNIPCDLSMDGNFIGSIGDSYFISVNAGPGDHIVTCTDSYSLTLGQDQGSKVVMLPYAISTTVSIPDSSSQVIIDLPDAVIHLKDAVQALGSLYFHARYTGSSSYPFPYLYDCSSPDPFTEAIGYAEGAYNRELYSSDDDDIRRPRLERLDDRRRQAYNDRAKFLQAISDGRVPIYPGDQLTCSGRRVVAIVYDQQKFFVEPSFLRTSSDGGTFLIRE